MSEATLEKRIAKGAVVNFVGMLSKIIGGPVLFLLLTRLYGKVAIGLFFIAYNLVEILGGLAISGFLDAAIMFASRHIHEESDLDTFRSYMRKIMVSTLAISSGLALLLVLGAPLLNQVYYSDYPALVPIVQIMAFILPLEALSRLALEEVERHRLASYTEKSQRYVEVGEDYMLPYEWEEAGHSDTLKELQRAAAQLYRTLLEAGVEREDARYYLPLSLTGQVGATLNTRTIEHMVLALAASPLQELRELAHLMLKEIGAVAPSLIRHTTPSPYHQREYGLGLSPREDLEPQKLSGDPVTLDNRTLGSLQLLSFPEEMDHRVLAIRMARRRGIPYTRALLLARSLSPTLLEQTYRELLAPMGPHDSAPNEFEHCSITWEVVLSAAAFAQLKRHRLTGMSASAYAPSLGFTHPPGVSQELIDHTAHLLSLSHAAFSLMAPHPAAQYALLSGHRRRIVWTANLREHYHFARLREDAHAQWDIRAFAQKMNQLLRELAPHATALLCGKDRFTVLQGRLR